MNPLFILFKCLIKHKDKQNNRFYNNFYDLFFEITKQNQHLFIYLKKNIFRNEY